jgi:hypothetical protein
MSKHGFSTQAKIAIVLGLLASLSCFVAAVVIFIKERDWPARYLSAGVTILAVIFIAIRRRRFASTSD